MLLLLMVAYLLAGYYLVPRLIRWQATQWIQSNLHKSITFGAIRFDPLHFVADLDDVAVGDRAGRMVAAAHLRIGFSPLSVFQSAYRLNELRLDRPFVNAMIRRDGSLNLTELIPPSRADSGPPTALRIDTLVVAQGRLAFADYNRALQPRTLLTPVAFTLRDFQTTGIGNGEFGLKAKSERGERFTWRGSLSTKPITSQGHFEISDLRSDTVYRFLSEDLPVTLTSGRAAVSGNYSFAYDRAGLRLTASFPKIALDDIGMRGDELFHGTSHIDGATLDGGQLRLSGRSWVPEAVQLTARQIVFHGASLAGPTLARGRPVRLAAGTLIGARLDYKGRRIDLGALSLTGLDVPVRRASDGSINLTGLWPKAVRQMASVAATPAWAVHLDQLALANSAMHIEDRAVFPSTRFDLTAMTVSAAGLGTDLAKALDLRFSARIKDGGRLSGQGMVTPATGAGELQVALEALPITAILPYLPAYPKLDVRSGQLGAKGVLKLANGQGSIRFAGDASLDGFLAYQKGANAPLASWSKLSLSGIQYRPERVDIATAHLSSPSGRIALMPDSSFDVSSLMTRPQPESGTLASDPGVPAGPAGATEAASRALTPTAAPMAPVYLRELLVEGGTLSFADYSITPNFEARIDALHGSIRNITNAPNTAAAIDLQGQVLDRFSPVTVQGTADLFHYDRATDIKLSFRNIELPIFNPYSGVYAGYSIAKGKLSTEFNYHIANRTLQAEHHIVIDQLQWGQATANKARVPWPVRLATSLLKDRNGVINLNVPVKGSLDEPTFRLAPIVWKIIGNVIEKAVTAPFRLIGSLFAGAEKAQYVDFSPGSAQLPTGSNESLAALATGLAERPGLNLDIPAGPGLEDDAIAMADTRIDAAAMAREAKKGQPTDFATLKPDEQHDRLEALYKLRFRKGPSFADGTAETHGAGRTSQRKATEAHWLRTELRKSFVPTQKELEALGAARSAGIRDVLLAKGDIDPLRIFLATNAKLTEKDGLVRFEMKLR
ncbi:MAG TPA: DUF748 domain-containing protein [Sphingobium sp.]|uniref:DUF748 domain-containing protein n=1 Tax=Sphingobium sp. TaxID=1912891 RepID=UPI002ED16136